MRAQKEPLPCIQPRPMLDEMQKTISMSQLTKHADRIAQDIESRRTVYRIKQPGRAEMLLMARAEYEGWRAVIELMQRPNWQQEWEQSQREFAEGRGRELGEFLAEARRDRAAQRERAAMAPRATPARVRKGRSSARSAERGSAKRRGPAR